MLIFPILFLMINFSGQAAAFRIESPAFQDKSQIPSRHTCDGPNVSPPLSWADAPSGAKSFALIVDDPDASSGTWVHWVVYDLPGDKNQLEEGIEKIETLPTGAKQGTTDFQSVGYEGPCPPAGNPHHYFFKLYVLNAPLNLSSKASKADLLMAMNGHVLAQANLIGLYERTAQKKSESQ